MPHAANISLIVIDVIVVVIIIIIILFAVSQSGIFISAFDGDGEVVQSLEEVLEGRSLVGVLMPAVVHDGVKLVRAVGRLRMSECLTQSIHHLLVVHP